MSKENDILFSAEQEENFQRCNALCETIVDLHGKLYDSTRDINVAKASIMLSLSFATAVFLLLEEFRDEQEEEVFMRIFFQKFKETTMEKYLKLSGEQHEKE